MIRRKSDLPTDILRIGALFLLALIAYEFSPHIERLLDGAILIYI